MSKSASSFRRGSAKFKPQPKVLIVCEDSKSSKTYLEEAARYFKAYAEIKFHHCGCTDPLSITKYAVSQKIKYNRLICVIDRDSHDCKNLSEAIQLASVQEINLQISYPCFEYWYLIHFVYTRKPYKSNGHLSAGDMLVEDLKKNEFFKDYEKGETNGIFEKLFQAYFSKAMLNGSRSLKDAEAEGDNNPSTPTHKLMEYLQELGSPQPVTPK